MGVKRVVTLATEEFILNAINESLHTEKNPDLNTDDKTIVGSINEVHDLLDMFVVPEYDVMAQMYYGILNPAEAGGISSFRDITFEMINNDNFISTKPGERDIPLGNVKQGDMIVIAIPVIFDLVASKDDGFGGDMPFDESVLGANGIDVVLNGQDYMLFGEFAVVEGHRGISIAKRVPIETGCECPPVTDEDITDIINGL